MKKYIEESKRTAGRAISEALPHLDVFREVLPLVDELQKQGAALHTRFENLCNGFPWDKDGTHTARYEAATDNKEARLICLCADHGIALTRDVNEKREGVFLRIQSDPRGWPIALHVSGREYRLGGK